MENPDEFLDYRTPKAQLIKLLEFKIKKPLIDSTLSRVLDEFRILIRQQEIFLSNGIVDTANIKFSEDALFIQSCGSYYGKCVDKLHEEILEHHKRMFLSYKFTGRDKKSKEARKREQDKLEERLNRGKRRKITLGAPNSINETHEDPILAHYDTNSKDIFEVFDTKRSDFLSDHDYLLERPTLILEPQTTLSDKWKKHEHNEEHQLEKNHNSNFVSHYNSSGYINQSYKIPYVDESSYDFPSEFQELGNSLLRNTVKSLFEKNAKGFIPDENLLIAKLRVAYCLRFKYFSDNKINMNNPIEEDLIGYKLYLNDFFRREKRKLFNMPQNSTKQLEDFCKALASKETLAHETVQSLRSQGIKDLPPVNFQTVILDPLKANYDGPFDPYVPTESDDLNMDENENSVPPILECIEVDPVWSLEAAANKLKQRELSGQFAIADHNYSCLSKLPQIPQLKLNNSAAKDVENDNDDDSINEEEEELTEYNDKTVKVTVKLTEEITDIAHNRRPVRECSRNLSKVFIAAGRSPSKRVYIQHDSNDLSPKKIRRLSGREIAKLRTSIIPAVKLLKWESFHSVEYHAEEDEGIIELVEFMETDDEEINENSFENNEDSELINEDDDNNDTQIELENSQAEESANVNSLQDSGIDMSFQSDRTEDISSLNCTLSSETNVSVESPKRRINFAELLEREKRGLTERVNQWKEFIIPKLQKLNEKTFSIQEYEAKIIQEVKVNESKLFKEIVRGKSATESVRLFLTTLHLVNTSNLEISGTKPGELCNDTMSLKLLNNEQHQQRLVGYQAPSELIYHERMERILEIRPPGSPPKKN